MTTENTQPVQVAFTDLGLSPEILRAVTEKGYTTPTPIQVKAIPAILAGKDIKGGAQTGTGKTAGFTLPILQLLGRHSNSSPSPARHPVRTLILTPIGIVQTAVSIALRPRARSPLRRSILQSSAMKSFLTCTGIRVSGTFVMLARN